MSLFNNAKYQQILIMLFLESQFKYRKLQLNYSNKKENKNNLTIFIYWKTNNLWIICN